MKKYSLFLVFMLLIVTAQSYAAWQPKFFIICKTTGDTANKYAGGFERTMASYLVEAFPCARAKTQGDINTRLQRERLNQLLGNGAENTSSFCDDLACDYLLNLEISDFLSDKIVVSASCIKYNIKVSIARDAKHGSRDYASIKTLINQVSKSIVDKLGKYEICPFTGPVAVNIHSLIDSTMVEEYGVYCNEMDQQFRSQTKKYGLTKSDWDLERKGISWTIGTMTFTSQEFLEIEEENGCYKCQTSNREGGRTYTQKSSYNVSGTGLSHQSVRQGTSQPDTRIELKFLSDGTYMVQFKGVSDIITATEKNEEQAVGTCDNKPLVRNETPREITIPLNYFFGPYPGKSTDEILQKKDSKVIHNPVTHENTTITIDYTLRKAK
jgi:hypothetical protein